MPKIHVAELEIHALERGSGDTILVFLDHLHASQAYVKEMEYLSYRFHVLSFDYPGPGRSTREIRYQDERDYDLWNFRADLACHLLLALRIDECYAMGAGGGALAALHFASTQAKRHKLTAKGVIADSFLSSLDRRTLHRALDRREHYILRNEQWLKEQHGDDWRQALELETC